MGIETTKALRARRRELDARIDRLIQRLDERSPVGIARRSRLSEAARLVRRRLKALAVAQEAVAAIEVEVGHVLLRLVGEGLSRNEAFELAGITRAHGRRYVRLAGAACPRLLDASSTDPAAAARATAQSSHLEPDGTHPGVAHEGRP